MKSSIKPESGTPSIGAPVYSEYHHEKIFEKLLDSLTQKIPDIKQELAQLWQERNEDKFKKAMHKHRGAFSSYGFKNIGQKMEILEYSTNPLDAESTTEHMNAILNELENIYRTYQH